MSTLFAECGSPQKSNCPEYPFWRLQNDGLWIVSGDEEIATWPREKNHKRGKLLRAHAVGGFPQPIYDALVQDKSLLIAVAQQLLEDHFPSALHSRILEAVGMELH